MRCQAASSCSRSCATTRPTTRSSCRGVGQHQMWASQFWRFNHPYTWVNSGGLGTMGFAVPAAIGAKVGRPDRMVWAVDGDGCFQMTGAGARRPPRSTASRSRSPSSTTLISAWCASGRSCSTRSATPRCTCRPTSPTTGCGPRPWAASGCGSSSPRRSLPAIEKANQIDDRPVVIDFRVDPSEKVYPMVPAGTSNDDVIVHPLQRGERSRRRMSAPCPVRRHPPHAGGAGREQGRRARPHLRAVRPAGLQHLLARRGPDRRRALQPHHDRGRHPVLAARADHQAAASS